MGTKRGRSNTFRYLLFGTAGAIALFLKTFPASMTRLDPESSQISQEDTGEKIKTITGRLADSRPALKSPERAATPTLDELVRDKVLSGTFKIRPSLEVSDWVRQESERLTPALVELGEKSIRDGKWQDAIRTIQILSENPANTAQTHTLAKYLLQNLTQELQSPEEVSMESDQRLEVVVIGFEIFLKTADPRGSMGPEILATLRRVPDPGVLAAMRAQSRIAGFDFEN